MSGKVSFSLFTKSWRTESVGELGEFVKHAGFDGIEFPLRDGYQIEPSQPERLSELARRLGEHGVKIYSIAYDGKIDESLFAGCAEAGIPMIRTGTAFTMTEGYKASEERERRVLESLLPLCESYGVKIGVQPHYGDGIVDCMGLLHLIQDFDSRHIGAIWDAAHDILAGQQPEWGLEIVWNRLCMVNLKNVHYELENPAKPREEEARWRLQITSARQGLASWARIAACLNQRKYNGIVCLSAEYTDAEEWEKDRLVTEDLAYAKSLLQHN